MSGRMNGGLPPELPVSITLPAGAWNNVLACISKQPWDIADPLIQTIRSQMMQAQESAAEDAPQHLRPVS